MYEMIMAMNVTDPERYARYREEMTPILKEYGGGFRYDFVVSQVLESASVHPITRVFVIFFRDKDASTKFFTDVRYEAVKKEHYSGSVDGFTVLADSTSTAP